MATVGTILVLMTMFPLLAIPVTAGVLALMRILNPVPAAALAGMVHVIIPEVAVEDKVPMVTGAVNAPVALLN